MFDTIQHLLILFLFFQKPITSVEIIMDNDLKRNGQCNYYMLKEPVFFVPTFTLLQKNSPYTRRISIE